MKVWEFVEQMGIDSHSIYDNAVMADLFKTRTGYEPCWPTHSAGSVSAQAGQDVKGPLAPLPVEDHVRVFNGWEFAASLEETLLGTNEWSRFYGRGSMFRASLNALKNADI